jgi:hypothetical protein
MHFLLGLCLGVSMDMHQNAVLFIPGFLSIYLYKYKFQIFRKFEFWTVIGGWVGGLLYFMAIHIFPNPDAYFLYLNMNDVLLQSATGMTHFPPVLSFSFLEMVKSAYNELGRFHFYENNLDFALIVASIVFVGFRRRSNDGLLSIFVLAIYISFVLIQGDKVDFYGILYYSFFLILVAETVVSLIAENGNITSRNLFIAMLSLMFVINSARHFLRPVKDSSNYDYYSVTNEILLVLNSNDLVLGSPTWWIGLSENDYRSAFTLTHYYYFDNLSVMESIAKIRPTVLILDNDFLYLFGDVNSSFTNRSSVSKLPISDLYDFIECCTVEVVSLSDQRGMPIKVHRVIKADWVR